MATVRLTASEIAEAEAYVRDLLDKNEEYRKVWGGENIPCAIAAQISHRKYLKQRAAAMQSGRYGRLPEWLFCVGATPAAVAVFGLLSARYASREGVAFPGMRLIAQDLGISSSTVARAIRELMMHGAITVVKQPSGDGWQRNQYHLHYDKPIEPEIA